MILLDTHTWIWWASESPSLSDSASRVISESTRIGISAISCWEVAMLVAKGRLELNMDAEIWIDLALQRPGVELIPLSPSIAVLSTRLPGEFHGDPADRIIVASALHHNVALATKDGKINDWGFVPTVW